MPRLHIRPIKLRRWFPPDDPVAVSIARLCILREDFYIEGEGLSAKDMGKLDGNSTRCRRLYFFRNSVRTILEIRATIQTLLKTPEFKKMLAKQDRATRGAVKGYANRLERAHKVLKDYRNAVGGHVSHKRVADAINQLKVDDEALIQIGEILSRSHYKFAVNLLVEMLVVGVPKHQQEERIEKDFALVTELVDVLRIVSLVLNIYVTERGLL